MNGRGRGSAPRIALLALLTVGAAAGCREDTSLRDALQDLPQAPVSDTLAMEVPPDSLAAPVPDSGVYLSPALDTVPTTEPLPAEGEPLEPDPAAQEPPGQQPPTQAPAEAPAATPPASPADTPPAGREWTAGTTAGRGSYGVLRSVRTARNEGFDRVVFEFQGAIPAHRVEYVDRPVRKCGSGDATRVAGDGWLRVRFTPAQAHTDDGRPTVTQRERSLSLPVLREIELTCDFEGEVTWVIGVASPNRYRVLTLSGPARLVVDVMH